MCFFPPSSSSGFFIHRLIWQLNNCISGVDQRRWDWTVLGWEGVGSVEQSRISQLNIDLNTTEPKQLSREHLPLANQLASQTEPQPISKLNKEDRSQSGGFKADW